MPVTIEKGKLISRGLQNRNSRFDSSVPRISVGGLNKPKAASLAESRYDTALLLTSRQTSLSVAKRRRHSSKTLAIALILAGLLSVTATTANAARKSTCANSPERAVRACIWHAAKKYKVSYPMLLRKAKCESTLNPKAKSVINRELELVHAGLFQFRYSPNKYVSDTWKTTPYADRSPWRAKWNSLAAAWMHSVGRGGEWECR